MELGLTVLLLGFLALYVCTFLCKRAAILDMPKFRIASYVLPGALSTHMITMALVMGLALDKDCLGWAIAFELFTGILLVVSLSCYLQCLLSANVREWGHEAERDSKDES